MLTSRSALLYLAAKPLDPWSDEVHYSLPWAPNLSVKCWSSVKRIHAISTRGRMVRSSRRWGKHRGLSPQIRLFHSKE